MQRPAPEPFHKMGGREREPLDMPVRQAQGPERSRGTRGLDPFDSAQGHPEPAGGEPVESVERMSLSKRRVVEFSAHLTKERVHALIISSSLSTVRQLRIVTGEPTSRSTRAGDILDRPTPPAK